MKDAALGYTDTVTLINDNTRRHFFVRHVPICSYYRQARANKVILFGVGAEMIEWNGREYRLSVQIWDKMTSRF